MRNSLVVLLLTILLCSCSSTKTAAIKYQPIFDFSALKSYGLYQREHKFSDWQPLSDGMRNSIELAIEKSMDSQGYLLKDSSQADVVVTYYLVKQNNHTFIQYNNGVNYCSYCLMHSEKGSRKERLMIYPGSLIIDIVKPKSRRSIWRATYPLKIKDKDNSLDINTKISSAVDSMLQQLTIMKQAQGKRA